MNSDKLAKMTHNFSLHLLFKYKSQFGTVIDVGVGDSPQYTNSYSEIFDQVVCFEPDPQCINMLYDCEYTNVQIFENALSNTSRQTKMFICTSDPCYTTIDETRYGDVINKGEKGVDEFNVALIDTKPLDYFLPMFMRGTSIDLLKIDAEGEDVNILKGAMGIIARFTPIIQIEHDDHDEVYNLIKHLGYVEEFPYFIGDDRYYVVK